MYVCMYVCKRIISDSKVISTDCSVGHIMAIADVKVASIMSLQMNT